MKHIWTDPLPPKRTDANKRGTERRAVALPARLTWKDQRGTTRFATVVARNVSDFGVYVECDSPVSIPLFRLVQFQLERDGRTTDLLPGTLDLLEGVNVIAHNASFELAFLEHAGIALGEIHCTLQATRLTLGGALTSPAWGATIPMLVPKQDLDSAAFKWST